MLVTSEVLPSIGDLLEETRLVLIFFCHDLSSNKPMLFMIYILLACQFDLCHVMLYASYAST